MGSPVELEGMPYEAVAADQTSELLGGSNSRGTFISHILAIPATASPGAITLIDGATSILVFAGGASSLSNLVPFIIPLGAISASGGWKITTGANISIIAFGRFG